MYRLGQCFVAVVMSVGFLLPLMPACSGGANPNGRFIGDQPGGVKVGIGDFAVSEEGYVLFEREGALAVGWPDDGTIERLPVEEPTRLSFAKGRPVVYVHSSADGRLYAVDIEKRSRVWSTRLEVGPDAEQLEDANLERAGIDEQEGKRYLDTSGLRLESTPDDSRILAASKTEIAIFETDRGEHLASRRFDQRIVDATVLSDSDRALVALRETWEEEGDEPSPTAEIAVVDLDRGDAETFSVPNCAARLAVSKAAKYAFMAPTECQKDPISVLSLKPGEEQFVRNLPGFGPVRIAPRGETAVGFVDATEVDESLFSDKSKIPPDPEKGAEAPRYYLMTIDTKDLAFELHEYGEQIPRYAMTPNGNVLLLDQPRSDRSELRYFDTRQGMFREFDGPYVKLKNYVMTRDSTAAYALDDGLFEVDIERQEISEVELGFDPTNLNISPAQDRLYLRKPDDEICVFSVTDRSCVSTFEHQSRATNEPGA